MMSGAVRLRYIHRSDKPDLTAIFFCMAILWVSYSSYCMRFLSASNEKNLIFLITNLIFLIWNFFPDLLTSWVNCKIQPPLISSKQRKIKNTQIMSHEIVLHHIHGILLPCWGIFVSNFAMPWKIIKKIYPMVSWYLSNLAWVLPIWDNLNVK